MSTTHDVDSITNSMMMAMEKECRKNGLVPQFHNQYFGNRLIVRAMAALLVAEAEEPKDDKKS